ncbi:MAG: hypothetical protein GY800_05625 [Planctomycetes bacterium]|nr:hypothetical protein [Planctomycetota bacterium]
MPQLIYRCLFCLSLLITIPAVSHAQTWQELPPAGEGTLTPVKPGKELPPAGEDILTPDKPGQELPPAGEGIPTPVKPGQELPPAGEGTPTPVKPGQELPTAGEGIQTPVEPGQELPPVGEGIQTPVEPGQKLPPVGEGIRILDKSVKEITVSAKDIKKRVLQGQPVHFAADLDDEYRTIEAEWIIEALNTPGVNKIEIKNAIIKGNLNLVRGASIYPFEESGLAEEEIQRLKNLKVNEGGEIVVPIPAGTLGPDQEILIEPPKTTNVNRVGLVSASISITDSRFEDVVFGVDVEEVIPAVFKGKFIFKGTTFAHGVHFGGCNFHDVTDFSYAKFFGMEGAQFDGCNFQGPTDFSGARFSEDGPTQFTATRFSGKGQTNFSDTRFSSYVTRFTGARFLSEITNFSRARFMSPITKFRAVYFKGNETYFSSVYFMSPVDFRYSHFRSRDGTYFRNCRFGEVAWFIETVFTYKLDFYGSTFDKDVLFDEADFPPNIKVNLRKTIYKTLDVVWAQLKGGRLDAPLGEIYAALREHDEVSADVFFEWEGVYRRLVANFENLGNRKSKLNAYYHFRRTRPIFKVVTRVDDYGSEEEFIVGYGLRQRMEWGVEYVFFGLTCGYGARWERPPIVAVVVISIFTIVYFVGYYLKRTGQRLEKMEPDVLAGLKHIEKRDKRISYDEEGKVLSVRGLMSRDERLELLSLWDNKMYQEAVNELFQTSGPLHYMREEAKAMKERWYHKLGNSFYGSFVTFTTLGLGGVTPSGGFKAAVITEGLMGWFTLALFLATLTNVLLT